MPSLKAFCLSEPSVLFISLATFETGVLAFECCFSNVAVLLRSVLTASRSYDTCSVINCSARLVQAVAPWH